MAVLSSPSFSAASFQSNGDRARSATLMILPRHCQIAATATLQCDGHLHLALSCSRHLSCATRFPQLSDKFPVHQSECVRGTVVSLSEPSFRDTEASCLNASELWAVQRKVNRGYGYSRKQVPDHTRSSLRHYRFLTGSRRTTPRSTFNLLCQELERSSASCIFQKTCMTAVRSSIFNSTYIDKRRSLHQLPFNASMSKEYRFSQGNKGREFCKCSSGIAELGTLVTYEWRPAADQLLLLSSLALAYIAGIVTPASPATPLKSISSTLHQGENPNAVVTAYEELQRFQDAQGTRANHMPFDPDDVLNGIYEKLSKNVFAFDLQDDETLCQSRQLSLQAVAKGPRSRLLSITTQHLDKEIDNLRKSCTPLEPSWKEISSNLLCEMVLPICKKWLLEEQFSKIINTSGARSSKGAFGKVFEQVSREKKTRSVDSEEDAVSQWKVTFNSQLESMKRNNMMMVYLKRSGKLDFYSDFLYFICFGSVRPGGSCDLKSFAKHAGVILEDILVALADGVTILYLELLSADSMTLSEIDLPALLTPSISSTRALERFRNEVALHSWVYENFESVVAMFEDRFDLWTLKACKFQKLIQNRPKNGWLRLPKKDAGAVKNKMKVTGLVIEYSKIPAKRSRELRALSGWKYFYSLYLEFSDIVGPLLWALAVKLGEALSFLLVFFIGRSLGLVYRGIRQSIGWTSR